jgi:hypothetical protein
MYQTRPRAKYSLDHFKKSGVKIIHRCLVWTMPSVLPEAQIQGMLRVSFGPVISGAGRTFVSTSSEQWIWWCTYSQVPDLGNVWRKDLMR